MKKLSIVLPVFALFLAIGLSAFTVPAKREASTAQLYWYVDALDAGTYQGQNTKEDEEDVTGCSFDQEPCEYGFTGTQLVIDNDPSSGVEEGELNNAVIIRQP